MSTIELFETLQSDGELLEKLCGTFTMKKDVIVWTFDLQTEETDESYDFDEDMLCQGNDDDIITSFSLEEKLTDTYNLDYTTIIEYIDEFDDLLAWEFSDPTFKESKVFFEISK